MDQAITRAAGAAPRVVGEFQGYVDGVDGIKPSVRWLDRKNMPQVGDRLFAIPAGAAVPRSWAVLLTSENHGTVGPVGCTFPWAGEKHERIQVMEIVESGAPPAPGADLAGLVRFGWCDMDDTDFIERPDGEYARVADIEDLLQRAAPIAAQAGQVALAQPLAMVSPSELRDIQAGRGGVPVRGNQWRDDQIVPIYAAPVAGQVAVPEGFALVPMIPTAEMIQAMADDEWKWEDLLAAAEAVTEDDYNYIANAPSPAKESK